MPDDLDFKGLLGDLTSFAESVDALELCRARADLCAEQIGLARLLLSLYGHEANPLRAKLARLEDRFAEVLNRG